MLGRLGFFAVVGLALVVIVSQSGKTAQATISMTCPAGEAGGVAVAFVWPAAEAGSTETWLDLSLGDDFPVGSTQGYGPFGPAQTAYAIDGLPAGITYHYRVQSRAGESWTTNAAGTLRTSCDESATVD